MEEHDTLVVQVVSGAQEALDKRNQRRGATGDLTGPVGGQTGCSQGPDWREQSPQGETDGSDCKLSKIETVASCQNNYGFHSGKSQGESEGGEGRNETSR